MPQPSAKALFGSKIKAAETTWLEDIVEFEARDTPGGGKLLIYTLSNGHRYALPLSGKALRLTQSAVSPVILPSPDSVSRNGSWG